MSNEFDDGENGSFFSGDKLTFREIIMNHMRKVSSLACVEFAGGYWKAVNFIQGAPIEKVYVPDTGEVYINAIDCFSNILFPHFDDEMSEADNAIRKEIEEIESGIKTQKEKDAVYDQRIKLYNKMFRALGSFLKRENYLSLGVGEE